MKMFKDPIVEEVHAIRAQIAAECDHDFHKITERAIETQKRFASQIKTVTKEELQRIRRGEVAPTDE
jgi:predicted metal-dependent phosphoesterase TrpH